MGNSVTGILSFIFGLLGVFTAHWYVGIFFILVAVILGVIALTDYLSYKWSAISGLVLSGLGVMLLVITLISDIRTNRLIVYYNSGDKVYLSNYDQIMEALNGLEEMVYEEAWQETFGSEEDISEPEHDDIVTEDVTEEPEIAVQEETETIAIQPDRAWYMRGSISGGEDQIKKTPEAAKQKKAIYQDENVIITYEGITEEKWMSGYNVELTIENLSTRTLTVQCRATSINGYMVHPMCSIEIAPGKKSRDKMRIWGDDAENIPMGTVDNIETKFHIFDFDDMLDFSYDTEHIVVCQ